MLNDTLINGNDSFEILQYNVFKWLWENHQYYITPGSKFGGHFMIYEGFRSIEIAKFLFCFCLYFLDDPERVHALAIVHVLPWKQPLSLLDLVTYTRLANTTKKKLWLVSFVENTEGRASYSEEPYKNKKDSLNEFEWKF